MYSQALLPGVAPCHGTLTPDQARASTALTAALAALVGERWYSLPTGDGSPEAAPAAPTLPTFLQAVEPLVALYARPPEESRAALVALQHLLLVAEASQGEAGVHLVASAGSMSSLPHHPRYGGRWAASLGRMWVGEGVRG